jgi:hypothetical protein
LTSHEQHDEGLRHENVILRGGTLPPLDQDCELLVTYHRFNEAEHGWNYTHQQLDLACREVDTCTHMIIHLEQHIEQHDLDLEERAAMVTALE